MKCNTLIFKERIHKLLRYDPILGKLYWIAKPSCKASRVRLGAEAGCYNDEGYIRIHLDRACHFSHNVVWIYCNGLIPNGMVIDHINGVRDDNRLENLRLATTRKNGQNLSVHRDGKSCGTCYHKECSKWEARVSIDKKLIYLGLYASEEEAEAIYKTACSLIAEFRDRKQFQELVTGRKIRVHRTPRSNKFS